MIKEVVVFMDAHHPDREIIETLVYAVNALIRKVNVMGEMVDRRYATNDHTKVLVEDVDPNVEP
jgi:hypothetical protein